jgi:hypothetical protein
MRSTQLSEALAAALRTEPDRTGPFLTVSQFESKHPATRHRMRGWIMRADLNLPDFAGLSDAVVRVGRSVLLDESAVFRWLASRRNQPKSRARNPHGRSGKGDSGATTRSRADTP